jgi:hypothetical protein
MVTITSVDGKPVSRSRNLRGIITYAGKVGVKHVATKALPDGRGVLSIRFEDGATVSTEFASADVLRDWVKRRRGWPHADFGTING